LIAKQTEMVINETSEHYRPCAQRGSLMFFFLCDLQKIHSFYKFSLERFLAVVTRSIQSLCGRSRAPSSKGDRASASGGSKKAGSVAGDSEEGANGMSVFEELEVGSSAGGKLTDPVSIRDLQLRVELLMKTITKYVFAFTGRGLLDQHKLIAASMLCFKILSNGGSVTTAEVDALVRGACHLTPGPMSESLKVWMTETMWAQLKQLEVTIPAVFKSITAHIESESLSWKRWVNEERLENMDLPRAFREMSQFHKLMLIRIFRPDRMTSALGAFVSTKLGPEFIERVPFSMEKLYSESSNTTPLFFMLFPGVDPTPAAEAMAAKSGTGRFVNISMGQGQEQVAIDALNNCAKEGGWIMLQNIHLMQSWLATLERTLESVEEYAHPDFRCLLTSEPPPLPLIETIPESILQRSIKVADETPTDIKSNLRRAWSKFNQSSLDACSLPKEFKACLFSLCFFHSVMVGRKKFGPQGWSRSYPFNDGDLTISGAVIRNYLEKNNPKVVIPEVTDEGSEAAPTAVAPASSPVIPWPDIRYILGEIMYGGHVTDQWDRRTTSTYLSTLMVPDLLGPNMVLAPGIKSPDASKMDYNTYAKFIEERLPPEAPHLFGLHPNAEIRFLTNQGNAIFGTIQQLIGGTSSVSTSFGQFQQMIATYLAQLPKLLDLAGIRAKVVEWNPYAIVALQESERMNALLSEIRRSLAELDMGLAGALNISDHMEALMRCLALNAVPATWEKLAYFSLKSLSRWLTDLTLRADQLVEWTTNIAAGPPKSVWIAGLFNPMSYLTAVMQVTARQSHLPLDCMTNRCVFTNYHEPASDVKTRPTNGVYVHGLFMEGASWEDGKGDEEGYITDSKLKIIHTPMPVLNVLAVNNADMDWDNMYKCPVYVTSARGATYLFTANIRMEPDETQKRWILAGAALLLSDD
jgi:dynein heavy chain, axonemal